jgi:hypothetical protein
MDCAERGDTEAIDKPGAKQSYLRILGWVERVGSVGNLRPTV